MSDSGTTKADLAALRRHAAELQALHEQLVAVRQEKAFSDSIIRSLPGSFFVYDEAGRPVRWNDSFRARAGYGNEEMSERGILDWVRLENRERVRAEIDRAFREGLASVELPLVMKDGSLVPFFITAAAMTVEGKRYLVGVGFDLTERVRAEEALRASEEALRESEERFRQLVEHAPDAIFIQTQLRFAYVNPAAVTLFGASSPEQLLGQPVLERFHPDFRAVARERIRLINEERRAVPQMEQTHLRLDGTPVRVEVSAVPFAYQGHHGALAFVRDITERKRAEQERRKLEAKIQQAAKLESLGVLAGGIAHDFNNLLVGVLGNADLALIHLPPGHPGRQNLAGIETAARRAADLCRQLLAYAGKGRFVVGPVDLNDVIREMAQLLEVSISKKAVLRRALAEGLPAIEADATQIRQVLMNLLTNASEALGDQAGVISLSTGVMTCDRAYLESAQAGEGLAEGPYVYVEVADTGCGMDRETLGRIFDPFFSTKFAGRGLGLAAVLGIVRGHRGAIRIYSEAGKGSTFKVLFPAAAGLVSPPAEPPREAPPVAAGRLVLLVDDEEMVREVGQRLLESAGLLVLTAASGPEALRLFRERGAEIACVLLDLTMPQMDGEETFRELRRIRDDVAVILSSGYNEQEIAHRFAGKGLAGFVQKPYRRADLLAAVRQASGRGAAAEDAEPGGRNSG